MHAPQALLGLVAFPMLAWAMSRDRGAVQPKRLVLGIVAQLGLAVMLQLPGVSDLLLALNRAVLVLEGATSEGAQFMFGYLAGGELPFEERSPGGAFIVAFRVLPLVLVTSALSALLYHLGPIPWMVRGLARAVQAVFRTSGALAFGAAASIFFGIIEGPVLIKPWLNKMDRSELFALLTCGMATVAGTVMVLYASIVEPAIPGALSQIVVASVLSVPAALTIAHAMEPGGTGQGAVPDPGKPDHNAIEALMRGTQEGTTMVINIAATIVVLFAMVHLVNQALGVLPTDDPLTLQAMVGWAFVPLVWLAGVPWSEAGAAGALMGTKTVLNEFVAYLDLAGAGGEALSPHSRKVMLAALCGFANLGSLGIVVGGLGGVMPDRRTELAALSAKAVVAGALATLLTGSVVAILG